MKAALALLLVLVLAPSALAERYARHRAGDYPPHHALWQCIHDHEADSWTATNGRYRGGLQLHLGWGYGSSYDAAQDPPVMQEWAAELAYRASRYSHAWLGGQWLSHDGGWRCLSYA